MEIFFLIMLTAVAGAYITSIACRRAQARNRKAGWHLAFYGAFAAGILTVLFVGQGDLFHPSQWDKGKVNLWLPLAIFSNAAGVIALCSSLATVAFFRWRIKNANAAD